MKKMSLKGLVVAAMLASSLFVTAPQAFAEGPQPSVVTVTGYAQQEVAPDTAYITIGTSSTDADAQQARTKNNQVMNNVTNAIKAMGIPADNLKTTGFYMSPNYDVKGSKVTSYTVTNSLTVKVSDLSLISQVISKAGSLGANRSITFVSPTNIPIRLRTTSLKKLSTMASVPLRQPLPPPAPNSAP